MSKLYFICGCMNSGKSTALITKEFNYRENGKKTIIVKMVHIFALWLHLLEEKNHPTRQADHNPVCQPSGVSSYLFHCYFNSVAELKQHFAVDSKITVELHAFPLYVAVFGNELIYDKPLIFFFGKYVVHTTSFLPVTYS